MSLLRKLLRSRRLRQGVSYVLFALLVTVFNMVAFHFLSDSTRVSFHVGRSAEQLSGAYSNASRREIQEHLRSIDRPTARTKLSGSNVTHEGSQERDLNSTNFTVGRVKNSTRVTSDITLANETSFRTSHLVTQVHPQPIKASAVLRSTVNHFTYSKSNIRKAKGFTSKRGKQFKDLTSDPDSTMSASLQGPEPDCGNIQFEYHDKELKRFRPALKGRNLCNLLYPLDAFTAALARANISYFMYGGTLIGSWRHHGIVPWDDDIDLAVPIQHQQMVYRHLMDLKPKFVLNVKQKKRWKLYAESAHPISRVSWKYPFLDINFYHENATHVWDHDVVNFKNFTFPRDWIFPLRPRPFNRRVLMAPAQSERMLQLTYNLSLCQTNQYNHRRETIVHSEDWRSVPCRQLHNVLPFVKRVPLQGGCNETLMQGARVLGHFLSDVQC